MWTKIGYIGFICSVLLVPISIFASSVGTKSLIYVSSAENENSGYLKYSLGFHEYGTSLGNINWSASLSFKNYLSADASIHYLIDLCKEPGNNRASYGFADTEIGLKFSLTEFTREYNPRYTQLLKYFDIGVRSLVLLPTGAKREAYIVERKFWHWNYEFNKGGIHRFYTYGGLSYGIEGLFTLRFPVKVPLGLHFNWLHLIHRNSIDERIYRIGVGIYNPRFAQFLEMRNSKRYNPEYDDGATYITPGIQFKLGNFYLTMGMSFRISRVRSDTVFNEYFIQRGWVTTPPWAIDFIVSHELNLTKKTAPEKGIIAGRIIDKETKEGLEAIISFPELGITITSDSQGLYKIELPPIKTSISISKKGYKPIHYLSVLVRAGSETILDFELEQKEPPKATLIAGVVDRITEEPLSATISFVEKDIPKVNTDILGTCRVEIPPGTYVINVKSEGYAPYTLPIVCKDGEIKVLNIKLSPLTSKAVLKGKVTSYSTKESVAAKISILKLGLTIETDSRTGNYRVAIPPGTYTLKVEANGYVSTKKTLTCAAEEEIVRNFELLKVGEKIVLRGIEFSNGSTIVGDKSYSILNEVVRILNENPTAEIEIACHTDSIGGELYNLAISKLRANLVRQYLIDHGIASDRLISNGYGSSMPIASNSTPEGRAKNRRIELHVLGER